MINKPLSVLLAVVFLLISGSAGFAHPGRTDKNGGHFHKATGEYQLHSQPAASGGQPARRGQGRPANGDIVQIVTVPKEQPRQGATVVGFTDGDTIKVLIDGREQRIRLYGIDTPEKRQAFGQEATEAIKQIVTGKEIEIKIMDTDNYGRSVAMVYADGQSVNELMVKGGHAWVYPKYCKDEVCSKWQASEDEAKNAKKALWKDSQPDQPWNWRRQQKNDQVKGI